MRKDVDLRALVGQNVLDQGERPTCVAFAATVGHEAVHSAKNARVEQLAPEALWWQATTAGHTSERGMVLHNIGPALSGHGQPNLALWPYDPSLGAGTEEPPEGLHRPPWGRSVLKDLPLEHDGVEAGLEEQLERSRPVILIVEVTDDFADPGEDGIVAIPSIGSAPGVYHAVTCVGAATHPVRGRLLLIKNSWGTDWGLGGTAGSPLNT